MLVSFLASIDCRIPDHARIGFIDVIHGLMSLHRPSLSKSMSVVDLARECHFLGEVDM